MKKLFVTITLLVALVGSAFAIPSKVFQRRYEDKDEVLTCWLNDTSSPIWTSNLSLEEQLEGVDYTCLIVDKEMTSYDKVYLIAKYGYIMRQGKNCLHIESESDGHYVDYKIDVYEEATEEKEEKE